MRASFLRAARVFPDMAVREFIWSDDSYMYRFEYSIDSVGVRDDERIDTGQWSRKHPGGTLWIRLDPTADGKKPQPPASLCQNSFREKDRSPPAPPRPAAHQVDAYFHNKDRSGT